MERGQGLPCAEHGQLCHCLTAGQSRAHQPRVWCWENILKERQKTPNRQDRKTIKVKNNRGTSRSEKEGGEVLHGAGADTTVVCGRDPARADVHTTAHRGPYVRAVGYFLKELTPMESPCWSRFFLKDCSPWKDQCWSRGTA